MKKQEIYDYIKSHKILATEDEDSPFDSSSFDAAVASGGNGSDSSEFSADSTSDTTTATDTTDTTSDSPFSSGDLGSEGGMSHSAPSFKADVDIEDDDNNQPNNMMNANAPTGKVLGLIFNDNDPEEVKVKVFNNDTGRIEIKDISEISI